MVSTNERIALLRHHEEFCYSICLYLVRCDKLACEAAAAALFNLAHCESFFQAGEMDRHQLLRKESARCALQTLIRKAGETQPVEQHYGI
ncbi:hypothetical protein [Paenibacillus piri]|uniref:Uncharacterized protein n=1 Tax=Paenibacillus piri TaxID=2547395 RepID=A0A4V2ZSZ1_9BACL|nr:hypothetical protein [Paenibacillus piri]TDF95074.1 hypothetical protein E1757_21295 [Paenibacillus piri]